MAGGAILEVCERLGRVVVTRSTPTGAIVDIPYDQGLERIGPVDVQQEIAR